MKNKNLLYCFFPLYYLSFFEKRLIFDAPEIPPIKAERLAPKSTKKRYNPEKRKAESKERQKEEAIDKIDEEKKLKVIEIKLAFENWSLQNSIKLVENPKKNKSNNPDFILQDKTGAKIGSITIQEFDFIVSIFDETQTFARLEEAKRYLAAAIAFEAKKGSLKEKIASYIESQRNIAEVLKELVATKSFMLVGERHAFGSALHISDMIAVLPELKKLGLTHVALEMDAKYQAKIDGLDYTHKEVYKEILKFKPALMAEPQINFLIVAKRIGLKVILIDDHPKGYDRNNIVHQNNRDQSMAENLVSKVDRNSKTLVLIGSAHVNKRKVMEPNGEKKYLAAHLVEKYGPEKVSSIAYSETVGGLHAWDLFSKNYDKAVILPAKDFTEKTRRDVDYVSFAY